MLILEDKDGKKIKAKKVKNMSTESYYYSIHRKKSGTIDGRPYRFHHYNYGSKYYFEYEENKRWYQILYFDDENLNFKVIDRVRE